MMADAWSEEEVAVVVADYFAMLEAELRGTPLNKTEHRRALQARLDGRSEGSVEFKHQNISAVLLSMGLPYISGYKPRKNFQGILVESVNEYIGMHSEIEALIAADAVVPVEEPSVDDILRTWTVAPDIDLEERQVSQNAPSYVPRKTNYLAKEAADSRLGMAGERFVLCYEQTRLRAEGKDDLAEQVEHVSRTRGDGAGFDILSFDVSGRKRFIEVKTTKYGKQTPFYISAGELAFSKERMEQYFLYRVFDYRMNPKLFILEGDVGSHCWLDSMQYKAGF